MVHQKNSIIASHHEQDEHRRLVHVVQMGFSAVLVLVLVLSAISLYRLKEFNTNMEKIVEVHNKKVALAFGMRDAIRQRAISIYTMLATDDIFVRDAESLRFYSYAGEYRNMRDELVSLGVDKKEKEIHARLAIVASEAQPANQRSAELLMQDAPADVVAAAITHGLEKQKLLLDLLDELTTLQQQYTDDAVQSNQKDFRFILLMQFSLGIIVLVVGILIARFVINNVRNKSFELNQKNTELALAYKNAEDATKAKSTFLANMSHEIRTPMTGVLGMLDLLRETKLVSEQKYFVDTAYNSAEALLVVIKDVLDFSKIEAGKIDYEVIQFDIRHLLEEVVGLYAKNVQDKGIEITACIENDVPEYVRGDPTRLRQILNNLISNAIKFTHDGEIIVELKRADNEGTDVSGLLRFSVIDTGIGIPKSAQKVIFGSFTQADESTTRKFGGTGLGLAICEQMTKLFGGEIGVESEEGKGSTFWFTANLPATERRSNRREKGIFSGLRVFVLTKSRGMEKTIGSLVQYWGGDVITPSGIVAGKNIPSVDVAILDVDKLLSLNVTDIYSLRKRIVVAKFMIGIFRLSERDLAEKVKHFHFSASITRPIRKSPLLAALSSMHASNEIIIPHHANNADQLVPPHKGISVLLVDDNAVNQQVTVSILQKQGFMVDIANDGLQAITLFKANNYNVVLMDCQMPVMDGFEATRKIRVYELTHGSSRTPIIALTANASDQDRQACFESGMDDFLVKPMRINAVIDVFSRYLETDTPVAEENFPQATSLSHDAIEQHFDMGVLSDLEELLDENKFTELVKLFIEHSRQRIKELGSAMAKMDMADIESVSHSLKGSSANLGAITLSGMCRDIVDAVRAGKVPDDIADRFVAIENEFRDVSRYLRERIGDHGLPQ
ncbi:MAG: ATP-binding protein [Gammaproteobacteria bacterium]|nr:ATP-binding protein [Gammaproteobacteria bacterium]